MISIIIPTYNRAAIIAPTLDSIIAQTYNEWECIVVDDHSTDNTKEVLARYCAQDPRIKFMTNVRKKGAQGARNTGLHSCSSEWVFFFDSDNILHPDCLEQLVYGIRPDVDVVQCFSEVINVETGNTGKVFNWKSYGNIHRRLMNSETYVDFNHAIIRRMKVLEIGDLDEDCPSMQEWDTHIRLSKTACYNTVEKVLVDYYVGAKDAISTDNRRAINGRLFILEKHLEDWCKHKMGMCRFVLLINRLISQNTDPAFRKSSTERLIKMVPQKSLYVCLGWVSNVFFSLKKRILK